MYCKLKCAGGVMAWNDKLEIRVRILVEFVYIYILTLSDHEWKRHDRLGSYQYALGQYDRIMTFIGRMSSPHESGENLHLTKDLHMLRILKIK